MRDSNAVPPEFTMGSLDRVVKFSPRVSKDILNSLECFLLVIELLCKIISLFLQCADLVRMDEEGTQSTSAVKESPIELQVLNWVGHD